MFTKTFATLVSIVAIASSAMAAPTTCTSKRDLGGWLGNLRTFGDVQSLNQFSFDDQFGQKGLDFFGKGNFGGHRNQFKDSGLQLVCRQQNVEIVQQRLAVLVQAYRKILTTTVCDVQQSIVIHNQHFSDLFNFGRGLGHEVGFDKHRGFDSNIAGLLNKDFFQHDGGNNLQFNDFNFDRNFNFQGHQVGSSFVVPSGRNWDDISGPRRVSDVNNFLNLATLPPVSSVGVF